MGTLSDRVWSEVLARVRMEHPELARAWFTRLEPLELSNGVVRVGVDDHGHHAYLSRQCQKSFNRAAQAVLERLVTVEFVAPVRPAAGDQPLAFEAEIDRVVLNGDYTFDNFVTGPGNRMAHAAALAVAESPGRAYNPLFVHGSVGLGKTHLLQATCQEVLARHEGVQVLYLSCETFVNHFIEAIERGAMHQFRYRYRHVDALVIDDIQFLADRERSREEFFHTFNTLYQAQKQIILSADESPRDIPSLEDRLVSRFEWGLVACIGPPQLETRMAIVRKKAKLRCVDLPEEVVHFLASAAESNTRELEGLLNRVLALSQHYGGRLDAEVAREAVGDEPVTPKKQLTISDILQAVTEQYNVRSADLLGKRRHRSISFPRQLCMYLAREHTPMSLEEIGGYFGGRDHTTVLHAVRTIQKQCNDDPDLGVTVQELARTLRK